MKKSFKRKINEGLIGQGVHTKMRYRKKSRPKKKLSWFQKLFGQNMEST